MNFSERRLNIIYGSQTGTAYDISTWLANKFIPKFEVVRCVDGNTFIDKEFDCSDCLNIFILSTAGNGDPPINFRQCWQSIFNSKDELWKVPFAVFGLGDSKYAQFNYASRMLFGRLKFLGSNPVCQLGCGDDQHLLGYSQEFIPWVRKLWFCLFGEDFSTEATINPCRYSLEPSLSVAFPKTVHYSKIVSNTLMTSADHFQKVHRLEFDILGKWTFEPGDVVGVLPKTDPLIVDSFIRDVLNEPNPNRLVTISSAVDNDPLVGTHSLRELFGEKLEITSVPTHFFYEVLRHCFQTDDSLAIMEDKLDQLASFSPEGAFERLRYSGREKLGICEVLADFHQIKIPIERLLEVIPLMAPRYYSVAGLVTPRFEPLPCLSKFSSRVTLCVAKYEWTTLLGRKRVGVASRYLAELHAGEYCSRIWLSSGFSKNLSSKILHANSLLLIGPGTGVAPIRAIVKNLSNSKEVLVLTGFRNPKFDFLFAHDWSHNTVIAWSRPDTMDRSLPFVYSDSGTNSVCIGRKTWVQDLIPIYAKKISKILTDPTSIVFICGRSHPMPGQVVDELKKIDSNSIEVMTKQGRIVFDTWA